MNVSNLFVCVMGMGVTFVGLTCIIFLILLLGKTMGAIEKRFPQEPARNTGTAAPPVSAAPAVPADGISDEVKVAILAALMQEPGFRLEHVININIRRA